VVADAKCYANEKGPVQTGPFFLEPGRRVLRFGTCSGRRQFDKISTSRLSP
jgi:hypothetical protein